MRRKQIILFMQPHHITSTSMEHVNQNECHFYKHMSYKIVLFSICNIDKEFMFVGFCLFVFGFNISLQIQLVLESWQISCQHISTSQASQPVELVFETMNDCEASTILKSIFNLTCVQSRRPSSSSSSSSSSNNFKRRAYCSSLFFF